MLHHRMPVCLVLLVLAAALSMSCRDPVEKPLPALPVDAGALKNDAGFREIEPVRFVLRQKAGERNERTSTRMRLFYAFFPADAAVGAGKAPLFVFLNGGPGCSTSTNLLSMSTAPYTLDRLQTDGQPFVRNANSWTRLGHLLYIDAPDTGFSYNLMKDPGNPLSRLGQFGEANFNPFIDAAQVLRLVMRYVMDHPQLRGREICLVGESYAGVRVTTMLNLAYFHQAYGGESRVYQDPALAAEVDAFLGAADPADADRSPGRVARIFSRQILIQPQITGKWQDDVTGEMFFAKDSIVDQLAKKAGKDWNRTYFNPMLNRAHYITDEVLPKQFDLDPYNCSKPHVWTDGIEAWTFQTLYDADRLSAVLGVDVRAIAAFQPEYRTTAYRYHPLMGFDVNEAAAKARQPFLGKLADGDEYLLGTNPGVYFAFLNNWATLTGLSKINPDISQEFGSMFLHNASLAKTFLTDADFDLIIWSPALLESFRLYTDIVRDLGITKGSDDQAGAVTIFYQPDSLDGVPTPASATIQYPRYTKSGHSVPSGQPEKLLKDVQAWVGLSEGAAK